MTPNQFVNLQKLREKQKLESKTNKKLNSISENQRRGDMFANDLRRRATVAELIVCDELSKNNIRYIFQKKVYDENHLFIIDIYIPKKRIAIEIDGGYHNTKKQKSKDKWREDWLIKNRRMKILRFSNKHVFSNRQNVISKITELINNK